MTTLSASAVRNTRLRTFTLVSYGQRIPCSQRRRHGSSTRNNKNNSIPQSSSSSTTSSSSSSPPPPSSSELQYIQPKAFAIGSFAGLLGSLAGMGGGFVMIPLMTSAIGLRLSQHQAHGTSLFAVAATGIAGAIGYSGEVQIESAAAIACMGMVTARLGAIATTKLSGRNLKKALGIFMILVAPIVPAKAYLVDNKKESMHSKNDDNKNTEKNNDHTNRSELVRKEEEEEETISSLMRKLMVPSIIGCGSGFLAGLFGVGGGAIVVPALTLFTDMTHYQALGTSLCAMSLPAAVGTATHYTKGNVVIRIAPTLATGAFVGAYLGGKLGLTIDERTLRYGFSGLMLFLGTQTLLRA